MSDKYMLYPLSVVELSNEMRKAVDDYKARKISSAELKETVLSWATNVPEKFFDGADYKLTLKKVVGVRRMAVINKMLDGYQTHIQ